MKGWKGRAGRMYFCYSYCCRYCYSFTCLTNCCCYRYYFIIAVVNLAQLKSKKGKPVLAHEGYMYRFDKRSATNGKIWRCLKTNCSGLHISVCHVLMYSAAYNVIKSCLQL